MKSILKIIIFLLLIVSILTADPQIRLNIYNINFGKIPAQHHFPASVLIHNTGDTSLEILNIEVECGCTIPYLHNKIIPKGSSTFIEIVFNSGSFHGEITRRIKLVTNDPENPIIYITLTANIFNQIEYPSHIVFDHQLFKTDIETNFYINYPEKFYKIQSIDYNKAFFTFSYNNKEGKKNNKIKVTLKIKPDIPNLSFVEKIYININSSENKKHFMLVRGNLYKSAFLTIPETVKLYNPGNGGIVSKPILIKNNFKKSYNILEITSENKNLIISKSKQDQYSYLLKVQFKFPAISSNFETTLNINTDYPESELIQIPVRIINQ